jgi:hypothetical protein
LVKENDDALSAQMMHDRMRGGRWKVFRGQNDGWLEEYGLYFRKDGIALRLNDAAARPN